MTAPEGPPRERFPRARPVARPADRAARDRVRPAARRPVRRHAARRLRRRRVKIEAPRDGDAMRDWGRLRHNDRTLWWSILARNKRSVALNLREPEGQRDRPRARAPTADIVLENFRPGTMEKWGLGPEDVHARNPRRHLRARLRLRPDRPLPRPRRASPPRGEAISGLRYINGYPGQAPPRCRHLARRHARRAVRPSRASCSRSTPASARRDRPGRRRRDPRRLLRDERVDGARVRARRGFVREPTGPRLPRIAPSNVYLCSDGKWVVIAANHDTLWRRLAKLMGQPELGDDERFATHHARGEHEDLLDEIIGEFAGAAHRRGARRDRQRGRRRLRAGLHRRGRLRRPPLPRARAARGARGRGPRAR